MSRTSQKRRGRKPGAPAQIRRLFDAAITHHRSGRLSQAERLYREILSQDPRHANARHLLGVVAHQAGRHAQAATLIGAAIQIDPNQPFFHNNLGEALRAQGELAGAEAAYRDAVRLDRGYGDAYSNLGLVLRAQGSTEDAIVCLRKAIAADPTLAEAHLNLGNALKDQGRLADAVVAYENAVQANPDFVDARINLGNAQIALERPAEGIVHLEEAARLRPDDSTVHANLGHALMSLERFDAAIQAYRAVVRLRPDDARAHADLARAYVEQGEPVNAEAAYRRALNLEPEHIGLRVDLARAVRDQGRLDDALAELEHVLTTNTDLHLVYNSLGMTLMIKGDFERATKCLSQAIEIKPDYGAAYENLAGTRTFTAKDEAQITRLEALVENPDTPEGSRAPMQFALGKMHEDCGDYERAFRHYRDGNRLVQAAFPFDLDTHRRRVDELIEAFNKPRIEDKGRLGDATLAPVFIIGMPRSGTTLVEQILSSHPQVHGAGELNYFHRARIGGRRADGTPLSFRECIALWDQDAADALAKPYLTRLMKGAPVAPRATDKFPLNFLHLGLIAILFPNARIIHCRRDPMDVCLSNYFQNFTYAKDYAFTFDLRHVGQYYLEYRRLMDHWDRVLPGRIHHVSYEDVVADQERESRSLVKYCGLEWNDNCLKYDKNRRAVNTASNWQVRQPIYRSSVQRWKRYDKHLDELKDALGSLYGGEKV